MNDQNAKSCWSSCAACGRDTDHDVLSEKVVSPKGPNDYPEYSYYQIVECKGCHGLSFRKEYVDHASLDYDEDGNVVPSKTIETYPRILKDHRGIKRLHPVPQTVRAIYIETINATKEGAFTLAGIGFRAVIEAICNDRNIKGKDLQKKSQVSQERE